jgi:hypothetical protein
METTAKIMTEREFLTAIVNGETITAEMQEKASAMLTALDKKIAKRKESGTKTQKENAEIKVKIVSALESGEIEVNENAYATARSVADYLEVSTQKASPLLKQLVESGELEIAEIKAKSGKVKGYRLPKESD